MEGSQLAEVPLLATLSEEDKGRLAERMQEIEVPSGTYVVQQGELSYKFYLILEGTAVVETLGQHLADLGPGDYFGEMGIVALARRDADVMATTPMRIAVLIGWDLRTLMDEFPRIRGQIERAIAERSGD